jgi:hypothetical protein
MNCDASAGHRRGVRAEGRRVLAEAPPARCCFAAATCALLVTECGGGPGRAHSSPGGTPGHGLASPSAEPSAVGTRSATSGGALFGGNATLAVEQDSLGRRLAIVRAFYKTGQPFPGPGIGPLMAAGSTLLVSLFGGQESIQPICWRYGR